MKASLKYRIIALFTDKYPLKDLCQVLGVSYSGYYKWKRRRDLPDKDETLLELISVIYGASKGSAGYRQITCQLKIKHGLRINPKKVLRIMRKLGIQSVARRRRPYTKFSDVVHRYGNLLDREFYADRPNKKWVTDITYIHTRQGVLYLSAIKDLHDGFIVGHRTGTEHNIRLVTDTVRDALKREKVAGGLQLHSDQGFQYTSHAYFRLVQEYGVTPSMSRRGNCLDNASMENFFGMLKTEWLQRRKFATFDEAKTAVEQYIRYYNYERCRLKTKMTPYQVRRQYA